jgi:hypothetical protein
VPRVQPDAPPPPAPEPEPCRNCAFIRKCYPDLTPEAARHHCVVCNPAVSGIQVETVHQRHARYDRELAENIANIDSILASMGTRRVVIPTRGRGERAAATDSGGGSTGGPAAPRQRYGHAPPAEPPGPPKPPPPPPPINARVSLGRR